MKMLLIKRFGMRGALLSLVGLCAISLVIFNIKPVANALRRVSAGETTPATQQDGIRAVPALLQSNEGQEESALEVPSAALTIPEAGIVRLGFVGDIMLDRAVAGAVATKGKGDYRFPFMRIKPVLENYDILFGNLEGTISDKGSDRGSPYSFRMHPDSIAGLVYAGFDILSLANNHSNDWGKEAFIDTLYRLEDASIAPVGAGLDEAHAYGYQLVTKNGTRIAYLAASEFNNGLAAQGPFLGIAIADRSALLKSIAQANKEADVVVVSFHFGEEYQRDPTDFQKRISRAAIDAGADLIVGHHPHVVGSLERYERGLIAYSLGNFVFDQNFSKETMEGALLEVTVEHRAIRDAKLISLSLTSAFQPRLSQPFP